MSELLFDIALLVIGVGFGFTIGSAVGQWRERRWQIQKRKMNAKIRRDQQEVDGIILQLRGSSQPIRDEAGGDYLN